MASPYLQIVSTGAFVDATGTLLASGTLVAQPVDANNNPTPFRAGDMTQVGKAPIQRSITNGAIDQPLKLANPTHPQASPQNIGYTFTITDHGTGVATTYPCVLLTDDGSGNWNIGALATGQYIKALPVNLVVGPQGPAGQTSFAVLSKQVGAAVAQVQSALGVTTVNLATPANAQTGIPKSDGSIDTSVGSDFPCMPFTCAGLSQVTLNHACTASGPYLAIAFYDPAGAFISGVPCPTPENYTANVPANAVRGLAFIDGNAYNGRATALASWMIVAGSTVPSTYVSSAYALPENTNLSRENSAILSAVRAVLPKGSNLFDKSLAVQGGIGTVGGAIDTGVSYYYTASIGVIPGRSYTILKGTADSNSAYGDVFFDVKGNVVSSRPIPRPDGCTLVAPAGAVALRFTDLATQINAQAVCEGTTAAYSPFAPPPVQVPTLAALLPTNGMKFAVFGDSISSVYGQVWQGVVAARLGVSLVYQDARPGRSFATLFESYGVTAPGQPLGNYDGAAAGGVGNAYFNVGKTQGQSFSANLNGAVPDFGFIRLGTNDASFAVGTLGDATSSNSLAGNMRYDIETILSARPTLRLFGVGPAWNGFATYAQLQAIDAMEEKVYGFYGIPYLSLFRRGFGNPLNNATATLDSNSPTYSLGISGGSTAVTTSGLGTHPSSFTQTHVDGPALANFAARYL